MPFTAPKTEQKDPWLFSTLMTHFISISRELYAYVTNTKLLPLSLSFCSLLCKKGKSHPHPTRHIKKPFNILSPPYSNKHYAFFLIDAAHFFVTITSKTVRHINTDIQECEGLWWLRVCQYTNRTCSRGPVVTHAQIELSLPGMERIAHSFTQWKVKAGSQNHTPVKVSIHKLINC